MRYIVFVAIERQFFEFAHFSFSQVFTVVNFQLYNTVIIRSFIAIQIIISGEINILAIFSKRN